MIQGELADKIIHEQENIMGPVAWEQAGKVTGLRIDIAKHEINAEAIRSPARRPPAVLAGEKLFGAASREVCRDAVRPLLSQVPQDEIPAVLK